MWVSWRLLHVEPAGMSEAVSLLKRVHPLEIEGYSRRILRPRAGKDLAASIVLDEEFESLEAYTVAREKRSSTPEAAKWFREWWPQSRGRDSCTLYSVLATKPGQEARWLRPIVNYIKPGRMSEAIALSKEFAKGHPSSLRLLEPETGQVSGIVVGDWGFENHDAASATTAEWAGTEGAAAWWPKWAEVNENRRVSKFYRVVG